MQFGPTLTQAIEDLSKAWREAESEWEAEIVAKVAAADPDVLLYQTRETLRAVREHMYHGGSYRKLIYDRLGFDAGAYATLLNDGMAVSNWICDVLHPGWTDWWGMTCRFGKQVGQRTKWKVRHNVPKVKQWLQDRYDYAWAAVGVLILYSVSRKEFDE